MPTSITSSGITFDDATTLTTGVVPTANIANGAVTPVKLSQPYTLANSVASTSGMAIDFTGIPTWAKRITVMFNGVSTSGTNAKLIQLGTSSGFEVTGYTSASSGIAATVGTSTNTAGFLIFAGNALEALDGVITIYLVSGSTFVCSGVVSNSASPAATWTIGGRKTLAATLDRLRVTTVGGTDTFDAGTINISYEG